MRAARILPTLLVSAVSAAGIAPAAASASPTTTEFSAGLSAKAGGIAAGADGNVWFTERANPGRVGLITPSGAITEFGSSAGLTKDSDPARLAAGPGGMWVTLRDGNKVARVTPVGGITKFNVAKQPGGITLGSDGNLWFTATGDHGSLNRITPAGTVTSYKTGLTKDVDPGEVTTGADGNVWFVEGGAATIGRITPQGRITEFDTNALLALPQDIATGPDGNLWFTEYGTLTAAVVRMTPSGSVTRFTTGLSLLSKPSGITQGSDGQLYFADQGADAIYRISTSGTITQVAALPAGADPLKLTAGPDGALWFSQAGRTAIARTTLAPVAGAPTVSRVTATSATLTASVRPLSQATSVRVEYGTTTAYGSQTSDSVLPFAGALQSLASPLTGLLPDTLYHARVVATNLTGVTYGPDMTFRTTLPDAPSVSTQAITGGGPTGMSLTAVVNPNSYLTSYHFEWGTSASYGSLLPAVDAAVGSDAAEHAVTEHLPELEPNTTYHFRVVASSAIATTSGPDQVFTTDAVAPDVDTTAAIAVTATGATATGIVNPRNSETSYRFEWGTTTAYDRVTPSFDEDAGAGGLDMSVTETLTALLPNTEYHYRLVAVSAAGATYGADHSFTTPDVLAGASSVDAEGVTSAGATLKADINPFGTTVAQWFEYGPSIAYGTATPEVSVNGWSSRLVTQRIDGLQPATTYHFRAAARTTIGTVFGLDRTFTTDAAPAVTPTAKPVAGATPTPTSTPSGGSASVAEPAYGKAVAPTAVQGTILVKAPGAAGFAALDPGAPIPSGTVVDARSGSVKIVSALNRKGATQAATFRGARFRISQRSGSGGMVDIRLAEAPASCAPTGTVAVASAKKKAPTLWSKDHKGKYRTHGRNSVATVRGTTWTTVETCKGTKTTVKHGAVSVRDRRTGHKHLVRAGHSYTARP